MGALTRETQQGVTFASRPVVYALVYPGESGDSIVGVTTRGEASACVTFGPSSEVRQRLLRRREEAVQGAGMWGLFHAQGAAESDASVRL